MTRAPNRWNSPLKDKTAHRIITVKRGCSACLYFRHFIESVGCSLCESTCGEWRGIF